MPPEGTTLEHVRAPERPQPTRLAPGSIILFGLDPWTDYLQTRQHIAHGLAARGWPVTYTTGPHHIWERPGPKWRESKWFSSAGHADGVVLDHPGRWIMQLPRPALWNRLLGERYVDNLVRLAGWKDAKRRIAYVFHPEFQPYIDRLGDCAVVYHADDSFLKMPQAPAFLAVRERTLVGRADLVIATSPGVARGLPGDGAARAKVLQNGADIAFFMRESAGPCPTDLAKIPPPRIGYCGTINPKVDLGLIAGVAVHRPDWSWVFVGKLIPDAISADPRTAAAKAVLDTLPNVHFLGPKPYADLPRYQANMDINTLCYRTDPGGWWEDVSPLKLYEHLAVGQPVIGADLEVLRPLHQVVSIARSLQEWLSAIENGLRGGVGSRASRRAATTGHGWDSIAAQLEDWILEQHG